MEVLLNTIARNKRVRVSARWPCSIHDDGHQYPATWLGVPQVLYRSG